MAAKKEPFSHLLLISFCLNESWGSLPFSVERPVPPPRGGFSRGREESGEPHSIGNISDRVCRLDIMQFPLASPLADQLPAQDTVLLHVS